MAVSYSDSDCAFARKICFNKDRTVFHGIKSNLLVCQMLIVHKFRDYIKNNQGLFHLSEY